MEAVDGHAGGVVRVKAKALEEARRRVVGVREQVQHSEGDGVLLEHGNEARAHAIALLLLAHDTEGNLEKATRAVRLEHDRAEHAPRRLGLTEQHEGLVVGCEDELRGVGAPDERQRRVDNVDDLPTSGNHV